MLGIAQGLAEEGLWVLATDLPGFGDSTAFAGERADDLASAFAESEVWIVPDAGHPAYVDAPDEFVARVAAFARAVDS